MGILARTFGLERLSVSTPEAEGPLGDYSADVTPPSRAAAAFGLRDALGIPAVFRAIQIISGVGAQLTLSAYRGGERIESGFLVQPDPWRPLTSFLERVLVDLATDGNAFLLKSYGADGTIAAVQALDPYLTRVQRNPRTGAKEYVSYDPTARKHRTYTADRIEHVWGLEVPGLDRGLGPVAANRWALSGQLDTRDYASGWFRNNDVPSGVLSSDQNLDPESIAQYRKIWHNPGAYDEDAGKRLGPSVRVLGKGLTYTPVMLKPEDAQWIEGQRHGVLEVALMFGMPANYLHASVEGSSLTYANLEMVDTQFLRLTLFPAYLRKIEAALTNVMPRGQSARFDTAALLRPDAKTRADIDAIYIASKVYDPSYVRARDDIPAGAAPAPTEQPTDTPATEEAPA